MKEMSQGGAGSAAPSANPGKPADKPGETPADPKPSDSGSTTKPTDMTPSKPGDKPNTPPSAADPVKPPAAEPKPGEDYPDLRGTCSIKTNFANDDACISKPAAEEGMQLHVGPEDYDNEEEVAKYLMQPGEESSECWTFQTPNETDIYYQTSVLSGRAGTHHIINQTFEPGSIENGGFTRCNGTAATGSIAGASKAYMPRGHVAPEYADVGKKVLAKTTIQSDMHYFNFTDKPILREYWMNMYFAKAEDIKREALAVRGYGGLGWNQTPIAPGTDMVYKYSCPIKGDGHILSLLGHYHAHGKRFTASIQRKSGEVEKVFEMFDYLDPAVFEYNSVVENPKFGPSSAGAVSGQLAVSDGDQINWECHIINDSDTPLAYVNEVKTGEMCNLWGSSLGIERISCNLR